ncbi:diadenylate cyclase CdaA [Sulfurihydrogenibium azorense]|uniref:diadenylate cyclase CdaA n=1 Tax=Sulfurihydrogenibium azorense TaxID=309806 RepID=UPI00240998B3|nr:diadenylate cyclase CdaA [Sulfurihydrogenibium azorense]MDM7273378.1 diadenylate cyclase CdaA [Sulfurihydrogenibium azorense]
MTDIYSLLGVLTSIELKDVLDILIVSVIVYFLLKFLAGTRGWQILIGLLFLLSVWLLAKILNLNTLEWIFENLWGIGIFALFVIFQPELRRGLAKLGEKGIFRFFSSTNKKIIDDVIRACLFMAERKIGSLIVFERNVDLTNYIEGQVKLDSEVSSELLITIFTPQTPLHDGAVIIKEGKIAYARAFLPLTLSSDIPQNVGTRHRAGIGISEETDAVALVVSEERGEISICVDGKIYKGLDILGLRKKLYKLLGVEKPTTFEILRKKLRREKNEVKKAS